MTKEKAGRGVPVELDRGTNDAVNAACKRLMAVKVRYVNNAMAWIATRPAIVQRAILGGVDEGMEHAYAAALRELADEIDRGGPVRRKIITEENQVIDDSDPA